MPHGFTKEMDTAQKVAFSKTHSNGEVTGLMAEKIPEEEDRWFGQVKDAGRTRELGRFSTKSDVKQSMKEFMRNNPKGIKGTDNGIAGMGGGIPGMDGDSLF